jgi:hypothetical protein
MAKLPAITGADLVLALVKLTFRLSGKRVAMFVSGMKTGELSRSLSTQVKRLAKDCS